jgi:hypothetical protein
MVVVEPARNFASSCVLCQNCGQIERILGGDWRHRVVIVTKTYIVLTALLPLILPLTASYAQAQGFGDALIRRYAQLKSYCDAGHEIVPATQPHALEPTHFERCADRIGRYKETVQIDNYWKNTDVHWSDGKKKFFFSGYYDHGLGTNAYDESLLSADASDDIRPMVRVILEWFEITDESGVSLRQRLNSYVPKPGLDQDGLVGYQATRAFYNSSGLLHIIWLSREDGLIRRTGWDRESKDGFTVARNGLSLAQVRVNKVLSRSDLWFEVPLRSRVWFAMLHHLGLSVQLSGTLLSLAAYLLGLVFWRARSAKGSIDDSRQRRRSMWRWFAVFGVIVSVIVIAIVHFGSGYTGGTDMPIDLVLVPAGFLCMFLLWLVACFLGARHQAEDSRRKPTASGVGRQRRQQH